MFACLVIFFRPKRSALTQTCVNEYKNKNISNDNIYNDKLFYLINYNISISYAMKYAIYLACHPEKITPKNSLIQNMISNIPIVACIIIKNNQIISYGISHVNLNYQPHFHAEYIAIKKAGKLAKDSTVIITLEPCWERSNLLYGKSCTDLLIDAKVAKVIYGFPDKAIFANGKGPDKLRKFGITVISEFMKNDLQELYSTYKPELKF